MSDDTPRNWLGDCPVCGRSAIVRNAAVVWSTDATCDNCSQWTDDNPLLNQDRVRRSLIAHELGWCACGNPEVVDAGMLRYLDSFKQRDGSDTYFAPKCSDDPHSELIFHLLGYVADDLEWTTHGGSIYGAWLTEEGIAARENLRRAQTAKEIG